MLIGGAGQAGCIPADQNNRATRSSQRSSIKYYQLDNTFSNVELADQTGKSAQMIGNSMCQRVERLA